MALVAVVGAKGAPGATTSVLALACGWSKPVLVADADPAGGDIVPGWLAGRVGLDRGLLSFAAATRHTDAATAADLAPHVVAVPDVPGLTVLPGLAHAGQSGGLDGRLWTRLAAATATPGLAADREGEAARVDLLADCGRISAGTPWPLVAAAGVVLLATRPTLRGVHHARHALAAVQAAVGDVRRVALLVCGPGPYDPVEVGRAVGLPVRVVLPDDPRAAAVLSDGVAPGRGWSRTVLARAARSVARPLATAAAAVAPATVGAAAAHDLITSERTALDPPTAAGNARR
ncbi:MAG TPA: hypothetical protein VEL73_06420 [Mycobacteriales bacterium]|nr:hypothetical protein [Mycobacteriales bacterium]